MQRVSFEEIVERLVARDARYQAGAYGFMREALDYTQKKYSGEKGAAGRGREADPKTLAGIEAILTQESAPGIERHVTGQQLVLGIREFALREYGPMAHLLLGEWGINRCEDFGEIVFNLIECQVLRKTDTDSREDFKGGYDFQEAFRDPFLPPSAVAGRRRPDPLSRPPE